jgi:hypothetical protein
MRHELVMAAATMITTIFFFLLIDKASVVRPRCVLDRGANVRRGR